MTISARVVSTVQELLPGNPDPFELAESIIRRTMLEGGCFEAHEFGRGQHTSSAASGGAVLYSMASIPELALPGVEILAEALANHVNRHGGVRRETLTSYPKPETTWGVSQSLLGLLSAYRGRPAAATQLMISWLCAAQSQQGDWSFRDDEPPHAVFDFYPTIALAKAAKGCAKGVIWHLRLAAEALDRRILNSARHSNEEMFLLLHARRAAARVLEPNDHEEIVRRQERFLEGATPPRDVPVVVYTQPLWHATLWAPLFYRCCGSIHPLHRLKVSLAAKAVHGYVPEIAAWQGPIPAARGVSWASGLAFASVFSVARDLVRHGIGVAEWKERVQAVVQNKYEFDVAISFGGNDRLVAERISTRIKENGYRVFYDFDFQHELLGEDLSIYLQGTYFSRSRFAIIVVSESFLRSKWASNIEWRAVLARMQEQASAYVLPYVVGDGVKVPGLNPTLGYVSASVASPEEFAELVIKKLKISDVAHEGS